jgi:hypothetical protein
MPNKIRCACGKQFRYRNELAGQRIKCPHCLHVIAVPNIDKSSGQLLGAPESRQVTASSTQSPTKYQALAGCAFALLFSLGLIGFGAFKFTAENRPLSKYSAEADGRVIKASEVYQNVYKVSRNHGPWEIVEEDPLYSTVATFEVDGKPYEAAGSTTCGWFIPGAGDPVRIVYVPGNPNAAMVRYGAGNEHGFSFFLMVLGICFFGLTMARVYYIVLRSNSGALFVLRRW